jgi:hypothetical protein
MPNAYKNFTAYFKQPQGRLISEFCFVINSVAYLFLE